MTHPESDYTEKKDLSRTDKIRQTMIAKHGSLEAYKEHLRTIAKKGGASSRGYAFAHGKVDPKEASKLGASLGGKMSKRGKAKK